MLNPEPKLRNLLILANELKTIAEQIKDKLNRISLVNKFRDRLLAGLALKIYRSFECLIWDCRQHRSEAMHHLKTIIETYFYYIWIAQDGGETRARLVNAKAFEEKIKFFKKNADYPDSANYLSSWKSGLGQAINGIEQDWKQFRYKKIHTIAKEGGMSDWYRRAYSLACEVAHLSDLSSHIPLDLRQIDLGSPKDSILWATIALEYSIKIIINVFEGVCQENTLGLENELQSISNRLTDLRGK